ADALSLERIALAGGFADVSAMLARLAEARASVGRHFAALFRDAAVGTPCTLDLSALWEPGLDRAPLREQLAPLAADGDGAALLARLDELTHGSRLRRLDESGRRRLNALLELLLEEQGAAREPDTLKRACNVLEAIGQRSADFSLLVENRLARQQLLDVSRKGDFLAGQLARNP